MLERLSKNAKITLSVLFVFIGIILLTYTYFATIKSNLFNEKNIELLETQITLQDEIEEISEEQEEILESIIVETEKDSGKDDYIGYLTVPDVNIKRGFVSMDSKYNRLGYNVLLVDGSDMPDVKNGNLILAAHRGNSKVSFFENLYKLNMGAYAYINYNGKEYKYKLVETYEENKDGSLTIRRDGSKNILTLITCTRNNKKTQTIFIFELEG